MRARTILVRARTSVALVLLIRYHFIHGMKTRRQQLESFRENTGVPMSSLIFHALWLSYGKLTLLHECTRSVGRGQKVFVTTSNAFNSFQSNLDKCGVYFVHQNFDKSQHCIVILTPRVMFSRVFKMVIYEIVLGYSFQLWNRTVVRELFLIFGAVIVSFVLETVVCFNRIWGQKNWHLFRGTWEILKCVCLQWLGKRAPTVLRLT